MFAVFDDVPSSTSLLMQCGYRSKTCTNIRATKIDGTLHRLCEFHRRKANESQQRLHERQREERIRRRRAEAAIDRPAKRVHLTATVPVVPLSIDPIAYNATDELRGIHSGTMEIYPSGFVATEPTSSSITPEDIELLELLLLVGSQESSPPDSPTAVGGFDSIVV